MGTSQFPLFHSYLLKAEREKERERERERYERWETDDTSEQIANEQLIKPFYIPYLATGIFQPVTTITQEFL